MVAAADRDRCALRRSAHSPHRARMDCDCRRWSVHCAARVRVDIHFSPPARPRRATPVRVELGHPDRLARGSRHRRSHRAGLALPPGRHRPVGRVSNPDRRGADARRCARPRLRRRERATDDRCRKGSARTRRDRARESHDGRAGHRPRAHHRGAHRFLEGDVPRRRQGDLRRVRRQRAARYRCVDDGRRAACDLTGGSPQFLPRRPARFTGEAGARGKRS